MVLGMSSSPAVRWRPALLLALGLVAGALFLALMEVGQYYLRARAFDDMKFSVAESFTMIFPSWIILAAIVPVILFLVAKVRFERETIVRATIVHTFAAVAFCVIHLGATSLASSARSSYPFFQIFGKMFALYMVYDFVTYWAIVGVAVAVHYYRETRSRELMASRLQSSLNAARLDALRGQLNPHFLFNTLNGITTLALKRDHDSVVRMLDRLSSLLRMTLDGNQAQLLPLSRELQLTDLYLEIQQMRFGERLTIRRNIDPAALDVQVPAMVIQPLVENALQHGISARPGAGEVTIGAWIAGDSIVLEVRDTGPGFTGGAPTRQGIGLANTRARLEQMYGSAHRMDLSTAEEGGAVTRLTIPLRPPEVTA
jgi:two-component system LytT family sensor kinase